MGNECCSNNPQQKDLQDNLMRDLNSIDGGDQTAKGPDFNNNHNNDSIHNLKNADTSANNNDKAPPSFYQSTNQGVVQASTMKASVMHYPVATAIEEMTLLQDQKYNIMSEIDKLILKHEAHTTIKKDRSFIVQSGSNAHSETHKNEKTGDVYCGQITNNQKCGFGRIIYFDGSFYEGNWDWNQYNGKGFYLDHEGNYVFGQFKNHKPEGFCTLKKKDGSVYEGEMKLGEKEGNGSETTAKGMKYKGTYKNGKMHGEGEYQISNLYTYKGQFADDFISGQGKCIWNTKKEYVGQWQNNRMHGKGDFIWPDGKRYTGDFIEDRFDGIGEFKWSNGTIYKGHWKQSKMHGTGKITTPEGKDIEGTWVNGEYSLPPVQVSETLYQDTLASQHTKNLQSSSLNPSGQQSIPQSSSQFAGQQLQHQQSQHIQGQSSHRDKQPTVIGH